MMKWLVQRSGPHLQKQEDFAMSHLSTQRRADMLKYLIAEYGRDTHDLPQIHGEVSYHLLRLYAYRLGGLEALQLLLQVGSESKCPGIRPAALKILKSKLRDGINQRRVSSDDIKVLQFLLACGKGGSCIQDHENDILWLVPASLPSDVYEELCASTESWWSNTYRWCKRDPSAEPKLPFAGHKYHITPGYSPNDSEDSYGESKKRSTGLEYGREALK